MILRNKTQLRQRRQIRVRAKVEGTAKKPRLAVFRSLRYISAQLIDDTTGRTLVATNDKGLKGTKTERSIKVGEQLAELALKKNLESVIFDRSGYRFHGRVKALAEAARSKGLKF